MGTPATRAHRELKASVEQQAATAQILHAMSRSPGDPQPVFKAVVDKAHRLCGAAYTVLYRYDSRILSIAGSRHIDARAMKVLRSNYPQPPDPKKMIGKAVLAGKVLHTADITKDPRFPESTKALRRRSVLAVPLMRNGSVVGAISCGRAEARPFTKKEISLLKTFAEQAVIAIENARLFNQTNEALERQTATADILKVIASSPSDTQPVFDAIARNARNLLEAHYANVTRLVGDELHLAAYTGTESSLASLSRFFPAKVTGQGALGKAVLSAEPAWVADIETDPAYSPAFRDGARERGYRSLLAVPMLRDRVSIGAIVVTRRAPGRFTDHQIGLLKTFADQAVIAIENVRLFNETKEALQRQTATADILKVIASSPSNVQPVFEAIVESAVRLCGARFGRVYRYDGSVIEMVASHGLGTSVGQIQRVFPRPAADDTTVGRVIVTRQPFFIKDIARDEVPPLSRQMMQAIGTRSQVTIPMLRAGAPIGAMTMGWDAPAAFNASQVALLQTFADQAVIAIENARLFNETKEALEQQTATADILRVISSSPTDVQPVFDTIARNSVRLCNGRFGAVFTFDGKIMGVGAMEQPDPEARRMFLSAFPQPITPTTPSAIAILERRVVNVRDMLTESYAADVKERARTGGYRSVLTVPMMRGDTAIGAVAVTRPEAELFSEAHVALLKTFADQAVIAIENVRLFNETKEALEQQTASAEILQVISSSPTDLAPVFQTIVTSSKRLLGGYSATVVQLVKGELRLVAYTPVSPAADEELKRYYPRPLDGSAAVSLVARDRMPFVSADIQNDPRVPESAREVARKRGYGSNVIVPMLHKDETVGALIVTRLQRGPLSEKDITLLQTFANQAVIAMENVRLFNETREALERQTATAEILKVISASPTNVQPVLDAIVVSASRLFAPCRASIQIVSGDQLLLGARAAAGAVIGSNAALDQIYPIRFGPDTPVGRVLAARRVEQIADTEAAEISTTLAEVGRAAGFRSVIFVPMILKSESVGVLALTHPSPGYKLSGEQLALVQTFADQAVIAIENVRLFNETREALEQQTATSEILRIISGSRNDLGAVFAAILANATSLCEAAYGVLWLRNGDAFTMAALHGALPADQWRTGMVVRPSPEVPLARVVETRKSVHIVDMRTDHGYVSRAPLPVAAVEVAGMRTLLLVPMLKDGEVIGEVAIYRTEVRAFNERQIGLIENFADQAVIAIENVRLFREIQEKSAQLEIANKHKSEFLANMSHELRTPLNAIIGFSEVLSERMFGEINEKQAEYLKDIHESGRHLLSLINDILDLSKIEAGRMELEVSSFDLPGALSNAITLIRERAQRHSIALGLEVDGSLGEYQGDERKFKQIMLNLLSNAVKFTPDGGKVDVSAKRANGAIEVAVRDTGIGIAPEDQAVVFEEFRQVGRDRMRTAEGTGLGLALTRRFVELHGGAIRLDSTPGQGSTFSFTLPLRS